jgi:hypothetical protein
VREDGSVPPVDLAIPAFGYTNHVSIDRAHGLIRKWTATHGAAAPQAIGARRRRLQRRPEHLEIDQSLHAFEIVAPGRQRRHLTRHGLW